MSNLTVVQLDIVWQLRRALQEVTTNPPTDLIERAFARTASFTPLAVRNVRRIVPNLIVVHLVIVWQPPYGLTLGRQSGTIERSGAKTGSLTARAKLNALRIVRPNFAPRMAIAWQVQRELQEVTVTRPTTMIGQSIARMGSMAGNVIPHAPQAVLNLIAAGEGIAWQLLHKQKEAIIALQTRMTELPSVRMGFREELAPTNVPRTVRSLGAVPTGPAWLAL